MFFFKNWFLFKFSFNFFYITSELHGDLMKPQARNFRKHEIGPVKDVFFAIVCDAFKELCLKWIFPILETRHSRHSLQPKHEELCSHMMYCSFFYDEESSETIVAIGVCLLCLCLLDVCRCDDQLPPHPGMPMALHPNNVPVYGMPPPQQPHPIQFMSPPPASQQQVGCSIWHPLTWTSPSPLFLSSWTSWSLIRLAFHTMFLAPFRFTITF